MTKQDKIRTIAEVYYVDLFEVGQALQRAARSLKRIGENELAGALGQTDQQVRSVVTQILNKFEGRVPDEPDPDDCPF